MTSFSQRGESNNHLHVQTSLEAESSLNGPDFLLAAPQAQIGDACFLEENVSGCLNRVRHVHKGEEDYCHFF